MKTAGREPHADPARLACSGCPCPAHARLPASQLRSRGPCLLPGALLWEPLNRLLHHRGLWRLPSLFWACGTHNHPSAQDQSGHRVGGPRGWQGGPRDAGLRCCPRGGSGSEAYQMLSLSATAIHGVKGWNLTTEGTPGFLFRNIWSSSLVMPAKNKNRNKTCGIGQERHVDSNPDTSQKGRCQRLCLGAGRGTKETKAKQEPGRGPERTPGRGTPGAGCPAHSTAPGTE